MGDKKDHGWAWLILAAAFVCQTIIFGLVLCFGIYFVTLLDYFKCHRSEAAVIGSIAYGTLCLAGPLSSVLYRRFGCRVVIMSGGLIAALGLFLSAFATSIYQLYLTYGLLGGFGLGLVFTPSIGILPDYFERWRYFATAFVTVGSAVGTLLFSPTFLHLIDAYTWQGSMFVNAGVALQLVVCGALMRSRKSTTVGGASSAIFDVSLLRDPLFGLLALSALAWGGCIYSVFSLLNALALSRHEVDRAESAYLVSVVGVANVAGRVASSIAGHWPSTNRVALYGVSMVLFGIAAFAFTVCRTFVEFALVGTLFGFSFGAMLAQLAGSLIDCFGVARLVASMGCAMFAVGVGGLCVPPLGGYLAEVAGGAVEVPFYLAGILGVLAGGLVGVVVLMRRRRLAEAARREPLEEAVQL